ncbi:hypothetical protein [Brucella thiophenivorans]|uniref:Uncharacterized protein n=1 Tax=Brucella thiophenivorans TaxID=571255 RepID=A0A256FU03_9HYPH|nr:hypothetical protein [Brucella thiophenivorans]OYR18230.1 hypothetical protein CEV31_4242 [Brucella thiophenivorans]
MTALTLEDRIRFDAAQNEEMGASTLNVISSVTGLIAFFAIIIFGFSNQSSTKPLPIHISNPDFAYVERVHAPVALSATEEALNLVIEAMND